MVNGYTRGTFSCRSLQLRVIGGSCIIPVPVSYVLRYVVDRSRKNALGGASVALFARELRINVRLMSKPRYYDNNPSNVSLLPNPLPQELIFRCPARCEALHSSPPLPHTRAGSTRQAEVNPSARRRSKPWVNKMSVAWMTLRPNSPRHVGWPLARPTPALLPLL